MEHDKPPSFWRCDAPIAVISMVVSVAVLVVEYEKLDMWLPVPAAVGLATVASVCLLWRRMYPIVAANATGVIAVVMLCFGSHGAALPLVLALYALARYGHSWIAILTGGKVIVVTAVAVGIFDSWSQALSNALWLVVWLEAGTIVGVVTRRNKLKLQAARDRAAEAERTREETARRRAAEERLRIARELHDSLTHAISVVNVQSSVALHVLSRQPEQAEAALHHIRAASSDAMRELRATLRALRMVDTQQPPGIAAVHRLVESFQHTNTEVRLHTDAEVARLPETVGRTVYRIVQEALTNVVRHSDAARVWVTISAESPTVVVRVTDDGTIAAGTVINAGLGIVGMRERMAALGGELSAGASIDGGFEVVASVPVSQTAVEEAA